MKYNFDELIDRRNTNCEKWDNCSARFGKNDLLPLWVADMDFKTPDFIINALKRRLDHEVLGYMVRPQSFFDSVKNWLKPRGWEIDTTKLAFTPGIVPAINFAVQLFTKPGDKVLINSPVYHPFMFAINDNGRELVKSPLINDNGYYTIDFEDFEKKLASGVKLLIFCNPHNPVGRVWTREELQKVGELCLKYNVLVISDEIHSDLIFKPHTHTYFASISDEIAQNTLTFLAPSKTFNIAGLSVSVAYSDNSDIYNKFNKYVETLHVCAGTLFGDIAFETAYNEGQEWLNQLLEYLDGNFEFVIDYLEKNIPQIKTRKPEGTYLMWLDCRELCMDCEKLQEFMINKAGLALNPGLIFGDEGRQFMRLNTATPRTNLQKALENIKKAVDSI